jgi:hypothetical protein
MYISLLHYVDVKLRISQVARVSWGSIDPNWTSPSRNFELKLLGCWALKVPEKQQDINRHHHSIDHNMLTKS